VDARAEEYLTTTSASDGLRGMLTGFLSYLPDKTAWAARQTYIALGFAIAAAAEQHIASCPMEGLNSVEVVKILDLPETLQPLAYLAVGEDAGEAGTPYPRFRFPETDLVEDRD
jgi:nitroreductase